MPGRQIVTGAQATGLRRISSVVAEIRRRPYSLCMSISDSGLECSTTSSSSQNLCDYGLQRVSRNSLRPYGKSRSRPYCREQLLITQFFRSSEISGYDGTCGPRWYGRRVETAVDWWLH